MAEEEFIRTLAELIRKAEEELERARREVEKAELAGIDVTEERKRVEELESRIKRLKTVYLGPT